MTITINRDIVDAGVILQVGVPDTWLEHATDAAVLLLAGDLGQPAESLTPSVSWQVDAASAEPGPAFAAVRAQLLSYPQAQLVAEESGEADWPYLSLVVAFRHPQTNAAQIVVLHAQAVNAEVPLLVQAIGTCGGAAGTSVVEALAGIVRSTLVTIAPGAATS